MLRGSLTWAVLAGSGLVLAACGSHPPASSAVAPGATASVHSPGTYKIGKPYQIDGIWYYPKEDWSYDETGIASWYGEQFHGRYTADGEIFNLNDLSAAHKTLPMPVVVRVTNLENGRSIKLRVNDRGPYARGRIIDVSRRAAQMLGFESQGTAKVRVQIDVPDSMVVAAAAGRGGSQPPVAAQAVAAVVSAPLTLPVAAIETLRGTPAPPPPGPAQIRVAEAAPPLEPTPAKTETIHLHPIAHEPPPAPIRVAENRPVAMHASVRQPGEARPYLIDDLPGEDGPAPAMRPTPAPPPPLPSKVELRPVHPTQIYIQAGAFSDRGNALRLEARLRGLGSPVYVTQGVGGNGASVYRVRLGPVANVDAADALLNRVTSGGIAQARIVVD